VVGGWCEGWGRERREGEERAFVRGITFDVGVGGLGGKKGRLAKGMVVGWWCGEVVLSA